MKARLLYVACAALVLASAWGCASVTREPPVSMPPAAGAQPAPPVPAPQVAGAQPAPPAAVKPVAPVAAQPPSATISGKQAPPAPAKAVPPPARPPASAARVPTPTTPPAVARPSVAAPPILDVKALTERLRATKAIGVFTKLSLKNKVDDLLEQVGQHYDGKVPPTMPELRQSYNLLMMKVLSLLQDDDPTLASTIVASREAIWGLLANPTTFAALQV